MKKLLVIVDMQNDFIDGALANEDAQKIVNPICDLLHTWDGDICFTEDTHDKDYYSTQEGKILPVPHCLKGTMGQEVNNDIIIAAMKNQNESFFIEKHAFGYNRWDTLHLDEKYDEIVIVGTVSSICVISNALILKSIYPEIKITVVKKLCADLDEESHNSSMIVMKNCHINII